MTRVDHDHINAAQLRHLSRVSKAVHHIVDDLLGHLHIVFPQMARAVAGAPDRAVILFRIGTGAGMDQFHSGKRVVFFDGVGGGMEVGQHFRVIQRDAELVRDTCL